MHLHDAVNSPESVQGKVPFTVNVLQAAIFNSASFSCIATDAEGLIRIFNVGAERMLGYAAAEVVDRLSPDDLHDRAELVERAAALSEEYGVAIAPGFESLVYKAARGIEDTYELTKVRRDGSRFPAVVSVTALRDPGNAVIGYLLIGSDNTARTQAEFARIEHSNKELAAANDELRSFSYSVSHDLRSPLRALDGFSLLLLEDYGDKLDDDGKDALARIRAASQRMGALIDDMLRLAQVTRAGLNVTALDFTALVRETIDEMEANTTRRPVQWIVEEGMAVTGDRPLLRIAMQNLLSNAKKFSGKTGKPVVRIGTTERDGSRVFLVTDNGVGFDMAHAGALFGAFQRLHHLDEFPGTGIGLAIVQRIMRRHGGRVWAEAKPGEGATFFFTVKEPEDGPA